MQAFNESDVPLELSVPLVKLGKDVKKASAALTQKQARWLVDTYYQRQLDRVRSASQLKQQKGANEPNELIAWIFKSSELFEAAIKASLGTFAENYAVGRWLQAQYGIGPVLSAACLAHFDIRKARTVGHFWRFSGLDPTLFWLGRKKGQNLVAKWMEEDDEEITPEAVEAISKASGKKPDDIRRVFAEGFSINGRPPKSVGAPALRSWLALCPYNQDLKSIIIFRMGETFIKFQNRDQCFYGKLYAEKHKSLWKENLEGKFSAQAKQDLAALKNKHSETYAWKNGAYKVSEVRELCETVWSMGIGINTVTREVKDPDSEVVKTIPGLDQLKRAKQGGTPMLPPGQIHNRARRWTVQLFISHLHEVMYRDYFGGDPPAPFVFTKPELGDHRHKIEVPLYPGDYSKEGLPIRKLYGE